MGDGGEASGEGLCLAEGRGAVGSGQCAAWLRAGAACTHVPAPWPPPQPHLARAAARDVQRGRALVDVPRRQQAQRAVARLDLRCAHVCEGGRRRATLSGKHSACTPRTGERARQPPRR